MWHDLVFVLILFVYMHDAQCGYCSRRRGGGGGVGVVIKLDPKGQERGKNSDKDGQGVDCLENKKIFMDIICVSSHSWI